MQRSLKVPERKRQQRLIDFGLQEYVAAALMQRRLKIMTPSAIAATSGRRTCNRAARCLPSPCHWLEPPRKPNPSRSELARDGGRHTAGCQAPSVIVDDHREQARSYRGSRTSERIMLSVSPPNQTTKPPNHKAER
jgi:hypothetical protein